MTYEEITQTVDDIAAAADCKCTYRQWPKDSAPDPDYILFYYLERDDMYADDEAYCKITALNLELYTNAKNIEKEQIVERAMHAADLTYQKSETYIDSEEMYEVLYETEVIIDE